MVIIVTIKEIISAMTMIELVLAPTQMMMSGPRDTFGREFKMVKYGSITLAKKELNQSRVAMMSPKTIARVKLTAVYIQVMAI